MAGDLSIKGVSTVTSLKPKVEEIFFMLNANLFLVLNNLSNFRNNFKNKPPSFAAVVAMGLML